MQRLAIIGGTGLDQWGDSVKTHDLVSDFGRPSAALSEYQLDGLTIFFLPRHGNSHNLPPHAINYRANIDILTQVAVDAVVAVNAVGGISAKAGPGSLCLPDQLVDYTWGRDHSFSLTAEDRLQHIEFATPFAGRIRAKLIKAAHSIDLDVRDGGCLGVTQGPRLETAAEIRRLKNDGCDLVGMTSMPEAALARERGLDYASLCVISNMAAGLEAVPVSMEAIDATLSVAMVKVRSLMAALFKELTIDD